MAARGNAAGLRKRHITQERSNRSDKLNRYRKETAMDALTFLTETTNTGASDLFIVAGLPLSYKKNGSLVTMDTDKIMPAQSESMIREIYQLADNRDINRFLETGMMTFPLPSEGFPVIG